jgi:O-succinylbenzoic acid--CoA ligase
MISVFSVAQNHPRRVALVTTSGALSYAELAERVGRLSNALTRALPVREGEPVAVVARPTLATVALLHALFAQRIPALLLHPSLPARERSRLVGRVGALHVFAPDEDPLPASDVSLPPSPRGLVSAAPLAIVPTSGSTGSPKLVVLSHAAFAASARGSAENVPLAPGDRWLLCLPPSHVGGLSILTRSLLAASAVVLFEPDAGGVLASLPRLVARMEADAVSVVSLVPTLLEALLALEPAWTPPKTLRAVLVGGAALAPELLARAEARGLPILTTDGLTEACSQVTTTRLGSTPRVRDGVVSSGQPLRDTEVRIGSEGRILVKAPSLCSSLWDARAPIDSAGFLQTEDRGVLDEHGELFVLGRLGDMIITGGENVDAQRVEQVLRGAPGVRNALVFGVPDPRFGELVACALAASPEFDPASVARWVGERLARHERPRLMATLDDFELLPNGKVDRGAVRARAAASLRPWP